LARTLRLAAFAAAISLSAIHSQAHEYKVGDLQVGHPWARATPGGAKVGGGYVKITNMGSEPDRLIGGSFEGSERLEIHEMSVKDGVMTMRPVPAGLEIKPGQTLELKPGGYHLMFVNLKAPLKEGDKANGTLTFERAGEVKLYFSVAPIGSGGPAPGPEMHMHEPPKTN
jgi:copper(I)-binding protein